MIFLLLDDFAGDIRLLGSGPRCGVGELVLPAIQPGSSIMPGKENPVIAESMVQVACRVVGNDATIATAAFGGVGSIFELNMSMPVIIDAFIESAVLLANVSNVFVDKLLAYVLKRRAAVRLAHLALLHHHRAMILALVIDADGLFVRHQLRMGRQCA